MLVEKNRERWNEMTLCRSSLWLPHRACSFFIFPLSLIFSFSFSSWYLALESSKMSCYFIRSNTNSSRRLLQKRDFNRSLLISSESELTSRIGGILIVHHQATYSWDSSLWNKDLQVSIQCAQIEISSTINEFVEWTIKAGRKSKLAFDFIDIKLAQERDDWK